MRKDLPFGQVNTAVSNSLETLGVDILISKSRKFRVINVYCPPIRARDSRTSGFDPKVFTVDPWTLLEGDINAHFASGMTTNQSMPLVPESKIGSGTIIW